MTGLKLLSAKKTILLAILAIALGSTGCRNCGNCGASPYGVWNPFAGPVATTVPAPGTNTLNIPQTARQQPYYTIPNPNAGIQPTPANSIPNYQAQPQPGWRQAAPGNNTNGGLNQNLNPTSFAVQNPNRQLTTGTSQTLNPNYRTTVVDERQDSSRLAVTDASQVRAPARFFPTGSINRLAQTPVATTAAAIPNPNYANQVGYGQPALATSGGPTAVRGSFEFQSNPVANNPYGINPYANAQVANYSANPPVTSSSPTVLAQGSTSRTNVANNTQSGWRNAQFNSQSNLNR